MLFREHVGLGLLPFMLRLWHWQAVANPGFWIRGATFKKFRPQPPILCNVAVGLHFSWNDWNRYENRNL